MTRVFEIWLSVQGGAERKLANVGAAARDQITMGRSMRMQIQFGADDKSVSRHQLNLYWENGSLFLRNFGNPILVAGSYLAQNDQVEVSDGFCCTVGNGWVLRFEERKAGASALRLVVEDGNKSQVMELGSLRYSIGSSSSNDIVLKSRGVSRAHAVLERVSGMEFKYRIRDAPSKNGVFIRRPGQALQRIKGEELLHGDETIYLGKAVLRLGDQKGSSFKRRRLLLYAAAALITVVVVRTLTRSDPSEPWPCVKELAESVTEENLDRRIDAVINLQSGQNSALSCKICSPKVEEYKSYAKQYQGFCKEAVKLEQKKLYLANMLTKSVWEGNLSTAMEEALSACSRQLAVVEEQANLLSQRITGFETSGLSPAEFLKSTESPKQHPHIAWPAPITASELEAKRESTVQAICTALDCSKSCVALIESFKKSKGLSPAELVKLENNLQKLLPDGKGEKIIEVVKLYTKIRAERAKAWQQTEANFRSAVTGKAFIVDPWPGAEKLPTVVKEMLDEVSEDSSYRQMQGYAENMQGSFSGTMKEQIIAHRGFLNLFAENESLPVNLRNCRAASRDFLEQRRREWDASLAVIGELTNSATKINIIVNQSDLKTRVKMLETIVSFMTQKAESPTLQKFAWPLAEIEEKQNHCKEAVRQICQINLRKQIEEEIYNKLPSNCTKELLQHFKEVIDDLIALEENLQKQSVIKDVGLFYRVRDRLDKRLRDN